jgi:hypothetical protein
MILTFMMGLRWASTIFPLIEQGMIVDGELIQNALEKLLYGLLENFFVGRIRRRSRYRRPEGRFCQGISKLVGVDRRRFLS